MKMAEGLKFCCSIGFELLSIETKKELDSLLEIMSGNIIYS